MTSGGALFRGALPPQFKKKIKVTSWGKGHQGRTLELSLLALGQCRDGLLPGKWAAVVKRTLDLRVLKLRHSEDG